MELQRHAGFLAPFATIVFLAATLTGCGSGSSPANTPAVASSSNASGTIASPSTSTSTSPGTNSASGSGTTVNASPPPVPKPTNAGSGSASGTMTNSSLPPVPKLAKVGSAVISWLAPTTNTDGTALTNLAGFYIHYGTKKASLDHRIVINTVGISNYVVDNLTSGTYYFSVSSYTKTGVESDPSKIVSKTI
jgi:hypothetical protein